jgi:hypothetical protein
MAAKYLSFNHKMLACGNEALLPFYILHQAVILSVGWFIIPLDWPILLKLPVISTFRLCPSWPSTNCSSGVSMCYDFCLA